MATIMLSEDTQLIHIFCDKKQAYQDKLNSASNLIGYLIVEMSISIGLDKPKLLIYILFMKYIYPVEMSKSKKSVFIRPVKIEFKSFVEDQFKKLSKRNLSVRVELFNL